MSAVFNPDVYAIDFGTSNSLVAAANRREVHPPLKIDAGAPDATVFRSVLFFSDQLECFYGSAALGEYVSQGMQGRLLRSLKRFLPAGSFAGTMIGPKRYRLEDLIGAFLREIRERANRVLGCDVRRVLLGRPALFSQDLDDDALAQGRLEAAARLAGFEEVSFCAEPVAAARDFQHELEESRLILVADFGGGTSDFSVVRMGPEPFSPDDVLGIGGVSVAGDALDGALMGGHVAHHFGAGVKYRVPFGNNLLTMPRPLMDLLCSPAEMSLLQRRDVMNFLKDVRGWSLSEADREAVDRLLCLAEDALGFQIFENIEACKRELSTRLAADFRFEYPGMKLEEHIRRDQFEQSCGRQMDAIVEALDTTLQRAGVTADDVHLVCLTGGTAQVPRISAALATRFAPHKLHRLKGFHSVVEGLAHQARLQLQSE